MEAAPTIPPSVWEWALTWFPRVFTITGIVFWAVWLKTGKFPFFNRGEGGSGRRIDDKLFAKILEVQENSSKSINHLADVLHEGFEKMGDNFQRLHEHIARVRKEKQHSPHPSEG